MNKREGFRFIQDESAHWYLIPAKPGEVDRFYAWDAAMCMGEEWEGEGFDKYRFEGPHVLVVYEWSDTTSPNAGG